MMQIQKAKVGLLGLMFDLYDLWPELKVQMSEFGEELARTLTPFAQVDFPGVCNNRDQVDRAVRSFEEDGKDLIIVVLLTYAPSHIALQSLIQTRTPILIFNTQRLYGVYGDTPSDETTKNHGMHGVQDLANVLIRAGKTFQIVTGHYQDEHTLAEVKSWCDAARTVTQLKHMRIGLIGYAMEGMGDFGLDETAFLTQLGVEVRRIPMKLVAETVQAAPQGEITQQMEEDRNQFRIAEDVTNEQHEASAKLEWALRKILVEREMHGFASHFMAVGEEGWLETLPFLAAAKLMADGFGFGGEGDVTSAAAVSMMHTLAGQANFTEMFTMDFAHNAALMMHMGEGNWKMARNDEPIHMLRSTLGLVPVEKDPLLLAFSLEPGEVTLVSLTTVARGKLKFVVAEGQILDFPYIPDLGRPHYKFQPDGELTDFLTRFSMAGGSHHQAIAYGRWAHTVEKIAALLSIDCARI